MDWFRGSSHEMTGPRQWTAGGGTRKSPSWPQIKAKVSPQHPEVKARSGDKVTVGSWGKVKAGSGDKVKARSEVKAGSGGKVKTKSDRKVKVKAGSEVKVKTRSDVKVKVGDWEPRQDGYVDMEERPLTGIRRTTKSAHRGRHSQLCHVTTHR